MQPISCREYLMRFDTGVFETMHRDNDASAIEGILREDTEAAAALTCQLFECGLVTDARDVCNMERRLYSPLIWFALYR